MQRNKLIAATILAGILAGMTAAGVARAETISYADAITTFANDCGGDIQKYCKGLNLGNGRIADCLSTNAAKVSPTCKASLNNILMSIQQREVAQASYSKVCTRDMSQRCSGVKGDGYILACLIKAQKRVSKGCNQAITDSGWR
jgi:hypothetical protein